VVDRCCQIVVQLPSHATGRFHHHFRRSLTLTWSKILKILVILRFISFSLLDKVSYSIDISFNYIWALVTTNCGLETLMTSLFQRNLLVYARRWLFLHPVSSTSQGVVLGIQERATFWLFYHFMLRFLGGLKFFPGQALVEVLNRHTAFLVPWILKDPSVCPCFSVTLHPMNRHHILLFYLSFNSTILLQILLSYIPRRSLVSMVFSWRINSPRIFRV
jgi:hypothetical protein